MGFLESSKAEGIVQIQGSCNECSSFVEQGVLSSPWKQNRIGDS